MNYKMKKCTKCKKEYEDDNFIGNKGQICTRCDYCRQMDRNRSRNKKMKNNDEEKLAKAGEPTQEQLTLG